MTKIRRGCQDVRPDAMRRRFPRWLWGAVLAGLFLSGPALADHHCQNWLAYQFQGENDAIAFFSGSDQFYTQGMQMRFWRNPRCANGWLSTMGNWFRRWALPVRDADAEMLSGFEVGQLIFTPASLKSRELRVDDRPYAGWLYGGLLFNIESKFVKSDRESDPISRRLQTVEIQLGILGRESGAEWAQTRWHEIIDDELPQGWDTQLPLEGSVNLFYQFQQKFSPKDSWRRNFDVVPSLGFGLGTVQVFGSAGFLVRAGRNISDFGVAPLRAGVARQRRAGVAGEGGGADASGELEIYAFLGAEGRWMAHNIFLDGNVFRDSHSVDKEDFVYDLKAGISANFAFGKAVEGKTRKRLRVTYTFVRRSEEFSPLPADFLGDGKHDFGILNVLFVRRFDLP